MPQSDQREDACIAARLQGHARGWLSLGRADEASRALDDVPAAHQHTPATLALRCQVFIETGECVLAAAIARRLTEAEPGDPQHWISFAYAVRRSETIERARDILLHAKPLFPSCATISYNLACYASQLGWFDEARRYLDEAIRLDPGFRATSLADADFEPLWRHEGRRDGQGSPG